MWRPRQGFDTNDMNFVTIPGDPTKTVESGDFEQTPWNTNQWLEPAVDDDCGFFTTFLARPGLRKLNQAAISVTIKQASNNYLPTLFTIAFFGARPGSYDDATDTFTPFQDYFTMNNMNTMMMDDNLKREMNDPTGLTSLFESKNVIPPPIEFGFLPGFYREKIIQDCALITPFAHTGTITAGSNIYTTHSISMPMFPTFSDNFGAPDGVAIQGKIQIYFTTTDYSLQIPPNDTSSPSMGLVTNAQVLSFSSPLQFL